MTTIPPSVEPSHRALHASAAPTAAPPDNDVSHRFAPDRCSLARPSTGFATTLNDPLVQAFESATVDPAAFRHREHLYVAWCYLRVLPLEEALARYVHHLRRLTVALGAPDKFHATITWAYLVILDDAMSRSSCTSFEDLLNENPTLLSLRSALDPYYERSVLESVDARRRFVLPRRA